MEKRPLALSLSDSLLPLSCLVQLSSFIHNRFLDLCDPLFLVRVHSLLEIGLALVLLLPEEALIMHNKDIEFLLHFQLHRMLLLEVIENALLPWLFLSLPLRL